ncbi:MAG: PspC domain-containing protein [Oscillospiraceae bacterium]|nr:PspC domain-containing protein [Oscillospiraceae bacterium]
MEPYKRLYRSRKSKILTGVCGGIGEYFNIDPMIVRIIAIVVPVSWVAYLIAAIILPEAPE